MNGIYRSVANLGDTVLFVSGKILKVAAAPFRFIFRILKKIILVLLSAFIGIFAPDGMKGKEYSIEVLQSAKDGFRHPLQQMKKTLHSVRRYKFTVKKAFLWCVPIICAVLTILTLSYVSTVDPALKITSGGETLGFAHSESEFLEARENAEKILLLSGNQSNDAMPDMRYEIAFVGINKFSDAAELTENIIKHSSVQLTEACGVYIDGEFFCAVKNEETAGNIFADILKKETHEGEIASFVEEITYHHGSYPDTEDCIWTERKLQKSVEELTGKEEYYTTQSNEDLETICDNTGKTKETVSALNPWITDVEQVSAGTKILVSEKGEFLTIKTVKTVIRDELISFDTIEVDSETLYKGTMRVLTEGEKGIDQVTSLVTYINGNTTSTEDIYRLTIKEPSVRRIQVGTREQKGTYTGTVYQQVSIPAAYFGGQMVWPVSGAYNINSDYAYRWGKLHAGLDIGMGSAPGTSLGKPVLAAADGIVTTATVVSGYGYYIVIDHGGGVQTAYGHLYAGSFTVAPGQSVKKGQQIASVGSTGYSTGPHLHFEVRVNGVKVDPKVYLGIS